MICSLTAYFMSRVVRTLKIKKVDDKPLVNHTKQKAKLHKHEPKQASIKGCNIYTVDKDPTKKNKERLKQINDGSFVVVDLETERLKKLSLS